MRDKRMFVVRKCDVRLALSSRLALLSRVDARCASVWRWSSCGFVPPASLPVFLGYLLRSQS
jgi:hypothetical protein